MFMKETVSQNIRFVISVQRIVHLLLELITWTIYFRFVGYCRHVAGSVDVNHADPIS
jgi:hypothetical protein